MYLQYPVRHGHAVSHVKDLDEVAYLMKLLNSDTRNGERQCTIDAELLDLAGTISNSILDECCRSFPLDGRATEYFGTALRVADVRSCLEPYVIRRKPLIKGLNWISDAAYVKRHLTCTIMCEAREVATKTLSDLCHKGTNRRNHSERTISAVPAAQVKDCDDVPQKHDPWLGKSASVPLENIGSRKTLGVNGKLYLPSFPSFGNDFLAICLTMLVTPPAMHFHLMLQLGLVLSAIAFPMKTPLPVRLLISTSKHLKTRKKFEASQSPPPYPVFNAFEHLHGMCTLPSNILNAGGFIADGELFFDVFEKPRYRASLTEIMVERARSYCESDTKLRRWFSAPRRKRFCDRCTYYPGAATGATPRRRAGAGSSGAGSSGGATHRRRGSATSASSSTLRRRDSSNAWSNPGNDASRRRDDMRRRSSDGWSNDGRRRGYSGSTVAMAAGMGFVGGVALGAIMTNAMGDNYYYHQQRWQDNSGMWHESGYYSQQGYYYGADGCQIGYGNCPQGQERVVVVERRHSPIVPIVGFITILCCCCGCMVLAHASCRKKEDSGFGAHDEDEWHDVIGHSGGPGDDRDRQGFLAAAELEYVDNSNGAIGEYFETAGFTAEHQRAFESYEERIKASANPESAIRSIRHEWGM